MKNTSCKDIFLESIQFKEEVWIIMDTMDNNIKGR